MKKIVSLTLILLLLVTALAACSGGANQAAAAPAQQTSNVQENKTEPAKEEVKTEEKAAEAISYKDGTYEGTGEGMHTIKVAVEVAGGKIVKVEIKEHEETKGVAEPALEQVPAAIVEKNSPDVDVVAGATRASEGIINAVKNALEAAK